jgi:predicted CoA-binding protein
MNSKAELLREHTTLVVVGLSAEPSRPSYRVSSYMQQHGYRIVPVNPDEKQILGEACYASLREVPAPVDFINVFRRPEFCPDIAREAVAVGAKVLWLQSGIHSDEARRIAETAGLAYVEDACVMVTHGEELG